MGHLEAGICPIQARRLEMRRHRFTILLALAAIGSSMGPIHASVVDELAPFVQPEGTHFPAHVFGDGDLAVNANHGPRQMTGSCHAGRGESEVLSVEYSLTITLRWGDGLSRCTARLL